MLKNKTIISLLMVTTIMLSISQLFGSSKEPVKAPYLPRQINLSGNYVNFSMPENFSLDLPAEDMLEVVDLNSEKNFEKNNSLTLLRRWWDFNSDSFFSKNVGTMMMTIHVYESLDKSKNIANPIEFIQALILDMEKRDKEEGKGKADDIKTHYPTEYISYVERTYNKQRWISSGSGTFDETTKVFHFWIPITDINYLAIEFNFAPNNDISMREFLDTYCRPQMNKIMESFDVVYSKETDLEKKIINYSDKKLKTLIESIQ